MPSSGGVATTDPTTVAGRQLILVYQTGIADTALAVTQWDDASGNARHMTQGTAGERPTKIAGPPIRVDFDGSDDELDGAGAVSNIISAAGNTYTGFVVYEEDAVSTNGASTFNNDALICDTGSLWGLHIKAAAGTTTVMAYHWDGADKHADVTYPTATTGKKLITWWYDGTPNTLNIQLNGGATVTTPTVNDIVGSLAGTWYLGGRGPASTTIQFDGKIDDLAIYNVVLSSTDRDGITNFYKVRHGIA